MTVMQARGPRFAWLARVFAASLPLACGDEGGDGTGSASTSESGPTAQPTTDEPATSQPTTGAANPTSGPADTGDTGGPGETGDSSESGDTGDTSGGDEVLAPIVGVPNLDDDDKNGEADWDDAAPDGDNDVGTFALPGWYTAQLQAGDRAQLTLAGETDAVRFWRDGAAVLGAGAAAQTLELSAADAGASFQVEFADFLRSSTLTVRRLGGDDSELDKRDVMVMSAPLIVNNHLQPAEYVWAVPAGTNASMIATMDDVIGDKFIEIDSNDIWIQDELEWATATAPGQRLNIAVDSIRDRQLDVYVKSLKAPDVQPMTWGEKNTDTTEDKFGNLEVTPPHDASGEQFPFGRIYYGDANTCGPNPIIKEFLGRQKVQRPIHVDTCWLCVGHVDEYISFVPDPDAPRGFRFLIADVPAAYALLATMDPDTSLPHYQDTHGYSTVGELLEDNALKALNMDIQADHLDTTTDLFKNELELKDEEIVRIPGLFERVQGCSYKDNAMAALIPGMLNLVVVNFKGQTPHIFVSDPFMRTDDDDQDDDPFIAAFRAALPPSFDIHFVDDWYTYHVGIGEVHCGTNVARTPMNDWWTAALPLIKEP